MSSFEELRKRVESAERQFGTMSRQRRDYGQRLIDMISMHERNLAESGGQIAALRQEAEQAHALAEERGRELQRANGENEQLRHMLHSLLTAIERNRSNEFEDTMLELDRRISAMVVADSDAAPQPESSEVSQAPEAWSQDSDEGRGTENGISPGAGNDGTMVAADWPDETDLAEVTAAATPVADEADAGKTRPPDESLAHGESPAPVALPGEEAAGPAIVDVADLAGEEADGEAALNPDSRVAAGPPSLEEVLELAEVSAQESDPMDPADASPDASGLDAAGVDGDKLSPEDLATLTEMLEESVAAAEEDADAAERNDQAPMQASIVEIADRLRAEHAAGSEADPPDRMAAGPADPDAAQTGFDDAPAMPGGGGHRAAASAHETDWLGAATATTEGDDTHFELLDEAELEKGISMSDRLFSEEDYADEGFGPVAAAEAAGDDVESHEPGDENAFDLSDLDLGGEIDGPPEAGNDGGGLREASSEDGFEIVELEPAGDEPGGDEAADGGPDDDGDDIGAFDRALAAAGGATDEATTGDVTPEEEAELERWRAEVLGRVAAEAGEAAQSRQSPAGAQISGSSAPASAESPEFHDGDDGDDALAELDAILAVEDLSPPKGDAGGHGRSAVDRAGETAEAETMRGLAPAVLDNLDDDTRAEILARVRQSHSSREPNKPS